MMVDNVLPFPNASRSKSKSFQVIDSANGKVCAVIIVGAGWNVEQVNKMLHGHYGVTAIDHRSELVNKDYVN